MKTWMYSAGVLALASLLIGCGAQFSFEQQSVGGIEKPGAGGSDDNEKDTDGDGIADICDPATEVCVDLCHVPPGNPSARHNISVGESAVDAHMRNHTEGGGDHLGPCETEGEAQAAPADTPIT